MSLKRSIMEVRELETIVNPSHWSLLFTLIKVVKSQKRLSEANLHIFTSNISNQNTGKLGSLVNIVKTSMSIYERAHTKN